MIKLLYRFVCMTLLSCMFLESEAQTSTVKAIQINVLGFPFGDDYYRIYHSGDLVLYEGSYIKNTSVQPISSNGDSKKENDLISERKPQFFVFHRDSSYGYYYDPAGAYKSDVRIRVDSITSTWGVQNGNLDTILDLKPDSIIWNKNRTELTEVYMMPAKPGCSSSIWKYSFSKTMNDIPESFSKTLDHVRKMKLYKLEYIIDAVYNNSAEMTCPSFHIVNEMQKLDGDQPEEVKRYFEMYRKKL
jgi:hypothetical protein